MVKIEKISVKNTIAHKELFFVLQGFLVKMWFFFLQMESNCCSISFPLIENCQLSENTRENDDNVWVVFIFYFKLHHYYYHSLSIHESITHNLEVKHKIKIPLLALNCPPHEASSGKQNLWFPSSKFIKLSDSLYL